MWRKQGGSINRRRRAWTVCRQMHTGVWSDTASQEGYSAFASEFSKARVSRIVVSLEIEPDQAHFPAQVDAFSSLPLDPGAKLRSQLVVMAALALTRRHHLAIFF